MLDTNQVTDETLLPVQEAIQRVIPSTLNPSTSWRWITRGVSGVGGERIRLRVWYVGRSPRTSMMAVRRWLEEVTAARLARMQQRNQQAADVTDEELAAVGLSRNGARQ